MMLYIRTRELGKKAINYFLFVVCGFENRFQLCRHSKFQNIKYKIESSVLSLGKVVFNGHGYKTNY